ncbi:MAG: hypothetical protein KDM91_14430 [Verrucomicrobiae bacterium]|nr:hypothetical protein [Verrucomicrobiae bacterium]
MEKPALQEFLATNLPFTIVTASGERYEVAHPDFVSIAPGAGTTVIVFGKDGVGFSLLDLTTISDVQPTSAASQP